MSSYGILIMLLSSVYAIAQQDSIYTSNKVIAGKISEITPDEIKYYKMELILVLPTRLKM